MIGKLWRTCRICCIHVWSFTRCTQPFTTLISHGTVSSWIRWWVRSTSLGSFRWHPNSTLTISWSLWTTYHQKRSSISSWTRLSMTCLVLSLRCRLCTDWVVSEMTWFLWFTCTRDGSTESIKQGVNLRLRDLRVSHQQMRAVIKLNKSEKYMINIFITNLHE